MTQSWLATGAPDDRPLDIPGADLPGDAGPAPPLSAGITAIPTSPISIRRSTAGMSWSSATAMSRSDVARILSKTETEFAGSDIVAHALDALDTASTEKVTLLGRRGPHQIAMTPKELGELGRLERAAPRIDPADLPDEEADALLEPGMRKSVTHLRAFAAIPEAHRADKTIEIDFDFFASPIAVEGDGKVERVVVECTELDAELRSRGTGETYTIPASMVVTCIGYRTPQVEGVPYEHGRGRFANDEGRIVPGLYCVGWAKRGPTGTIGTNKPDGYAIINLLKEDIVPDSGKPGREGLDALLGERGTDIVTFQDWKKIEEAETGRARDGAPREKFTAIEDMIAARN